LRAKSHGVCFIIFIIIIIIINHMGQFYNQTTPEHSPSQKLRLWVRIPQEACVCSKFVWSSVGNGLITGRHTVKGVLPTVYDYKAVNQIPWSITDRSSHRLSAGICLLRDVGIVIFGGKWEVSSKQIAGGLRIP
jgi:hypothetical protein